MCVDTTRHVKRLSVDKNQCWPLSVSTVDTIRLFKKCCYLKLNRYPQLIPPGLFKKCHESGSWQALILISVGINCLYYQAYQKVSRVLVSTRIDLDLCRYQLSILPGLSKTVNSLGYQQELISKLIDIHSRFHQVYQNVLIVLASTRIDLDLCRYQLSILPGLSKCVDSLGLVKNWSQYHLGSTVNTSKPT
jgi:hypothetical protein